MASPVKRPHFVVNQLGQSADRRGPFESREAAEEWAQKHYNYPAWAVPASPANDLARNRRLLDKDGNPTTEE